MPDAQVRLSEIIAPLFHSKFHSNKLHQVDKGGRSSFKSSKNEIKIAKQMLKDTTCECVVARQNQVDHRDTTFAGLLIAFDRLKIKLLPSIHYPRGKTSKLWIRLPKGNEVHFKQMKEIEKIKGVRPSKPGNQVKILWFFEITQFKSSLEIKQVISSYIRGADVGYFWNLYEYNPHEKRSHWTYEWVIEMKQREDAYVQHTNYNDHPQELLDRWLGHLALQEIEAERLLNPENYKHIYLGQPANLTGTIYKRFDYDKHTEVMNVRNDYAKLNIGVDYGEVDATAFTLIAFKKGYKGIDVPLSYYHKNGVSPGVRDPFSYAYDFFEFVDKCYSVYGKIMIAYIDTGGSKAFYGVLKQIQLQLRNNKVIIEPVVKRRKKEDSLPKDKKHIEQRITTTNDMFITEYLKINRTCKHLIQAIVEAERDKNEDRKDDGSTMIDPLDSFEYGWLNDMGIIDDVLKIMKINKAHSMGGIVNGGY